MKEKEEESLKRGMEQGVQLGRQEEKIAIAKNLLEIQMSLEGIAKITGLTIEEIKEIQIK